MAKYTLPVATENILGGVKIGNGIDVTQDGVISIKDYNQMKEDISGLEESVKQGKELIAASITEKGVDTPATATFQQMANNIKNLLAITDYANNNGNNYSMSYDEVTVERVS